MDDSEPNGIKSDSSPLKAGTDELGKKAAGFLRDAKPKLTRLIVLARPRAQAARHEALRYAREHEDEIKLAAAKLARHRLRGPLGLLVDALTQDSSSTDQAHGTKCLRCETMNMFGAKFCHECGISLKSETGHNQ